MPMKVRELGQNPISKEKPAGEDAHYEPEFEELQQEIDKLSIATTSGEGTDWKRVTSLCVTILSEKSKDLLVAAYLVTGLTKTHGFEGFTVGLAFMADLVDTFWDTMFPPKRRMRGRMNALNWWMERMESFLKSMSDAEPLPPEQIEAAQKNLDALDKALGDKSDDAPSMRELANYLTLVPVQETQQEPEPEPEQVELGDHQEQQPAQPEQPEQSEQPAQQPAPKQQAKKQQAPPAAPQAAPASESKKEADQALRSANNQLLGVADFYLKNEPTSPLSYRLRRQAVWMPLTGAPPAEGGKTMLPPPESMIKPSVEQLLQSGNNEAALQAAEQHVTEYLFWLDLSRLTATALENLGSAYKDAYDGVCAEALLLVQRLQGLEDLSFSDGTPFADADTRAWLKSLSLGSGGDAAASGGDEAQQAVNQAFAQARTLLKDKKHVDAAETLHKGLAAAGSGRERLLWRIAVGRLQLLAGRPELAEAMARDVVADIDAAALEAWDPALALQGLQLAHEASETLAGDKGKQGEKAEQAEAHAQRAREMLLRINRVNPAEAMRIFGAN